jgi:PAS domain S-box-containing protein
MAPEPADRLRERIHDLEARLAEAEETLSAIQTGSVDAFVASGPDGDVIYTLQGADEGYRLFIENMGEGALTTAADGLILFANERFASMLGRPAGQVIGSYLPCFVAPADREMAHALLAATSGAKAELHFERVDAGPVPAYVSASRLRRGGADCLALIVTDLTQQKRNQEMVAAGRLAQTILEQAAIPIVVTDPAGKIIQANHAVETLIGRPVLLRDFDTVFHLRASTEEGQLSFARIQEMLRAESRIAGLQAAAQAANGRPVDVLINAASLASPHAGASGSIVVLVDITERKRAEEALRASNERFNKLQSSNVIGIVSADSEKIYEANDLFLKMIGYSREDLQQGGIDWRRITPPEFLPASEQARRQLLEAGSLAPFEKEYIRKDGSRIPILIGGTLLERDPMRHICFVLDLTERKKLESKLQEKDKLESLGLLAGGIAHDFNNLLVGIMGNAALAEEMAPEGTLLCQALESIVKSSQSAAHLTRQMLAYAGKGQFVLERVYLSALVEETLSLLRSAIPSDVFVHLDLERNIFPLEADPSQMQQVVMNLILNAAEAMGDRPGTVAVRTANCTLDAARIQRELGDAPLDPGSYVILEVRDTGGGMDEATQARIFDPFFTTKFLGRGLGLSAVAGIVRGHKGAIRVKSSQGAGSTFTVWFPAMAPAAGTIKTPHTPEEMVRGSETVLVVDDEATVLETARRSLERHGYAVLTAASGNAAIEILQRDPEGISMVLLDLRMPGMSGQQTLEELLKINPDLDVLVTSGYTEAETMRFFTGMRVCGFVQKPYTPGALARQVRAALGSRRPSRSGAA